MSREQGFLLDVSHDENMIKLDKITMLIHDAVRIYYFVKYKVVINDRISYETMMEQTEPFDQTVESILKNFDDEIRKHYPSEEVEYTDKDMEFLRKEFFEIYFPISSWNTTNVTDMSFLFQSQQQFNEDISGWDTSNVRNMSYMFCFASKFNQSLNSWNVSNVTDMSFMFMSAINFNQPLDAWETEHVTDMSFMFYNAYHFNQNVNSWDISNVTDMKSMFYNAISFSYNLIHWNFTNKNTTNMFMIYYQDEYMIKFINELTPSVNKNVFSQLGDFYAKFGNQNVILNWEGNVFNDFYLLYLYIKYSRNINCVIRLPNFRFDLIIQDDPTDHDIYYGMVEIIDDVVNCIIEKDSEIIVILLMFRFKIDNNKEDGHANLLVYKKNLNSFEHFEPNNHPESDRRLKKRKIDTVKMLINEINKRIFPLRPKIRYVPPKMTCPSFSGPQTYESMIPYTETEGYCKVWSYFMTELSLANPTLSMDTMLKKFDMDPRVDTVEKKSVYLLQLMRGYVRFINHIHSTYFHVLESFRNKNPHAYDYSELMKVLYRIYEQHVKTNMNLEEMKTKFNIENVDQNTKNALIDMIIDLQRRV